jgi:hypothetical protein
MVVEVAILNQDFVEVLVDHVDVEIGFATWLGGAPLLLCWEFLIVIRGSVGRRKLVDTGEL